MVSEEVFRAFLRARQNEAPLFPSAEMPNYPANVLDDEAVGDLYAYIRSLPVDSPAIEDIPAFQAILESTEGLFQP